MNRKHAEKHFIEKIKEDRILKDVEAVTDSYCELIKLFPDNPDYIKELLEYLYFNYKYAQPLDWEEYLDKGIELAKNARNDITDKSESIFFLYEYKFIIELIRYDASYAEEFETEYMHTLLNEAIKSDPFNAEAYLEKGNLYEAEDEFEKAEKEFEKAEHIRSSDTALFNIANNNEVTGNIEKAIENYKKLGNNTKSDIVKKIAWESLIGIYKKTGERDKVDYYEDLLDELD